MAREHQTSQLSGKEAAKSQMTPQNQNQNARKTFANKAATPHGFFLSFHEPNPSYLAFDPSGRYPVSNPISKGSHKAFATFTPSGKAQTPELWLCLPAR